MGVIEGVQAYAPTPDDAVGLRFALSICESAWPVPGCADTTPNSGKGAVVSARRSGWIAVASVVVAACAGGDGAGPGETDDGVCHIVWREDGSEVELTMSTDTRTVTVARDELSDQHSFDAEGRLTRTSYLGGPLRPAREYTYDDQGHLISAITFGEPGVVQCTNAYDDEDRIINHNCTGADIAYRYDDEGRIDQVTSDAAGDDMPVVRTIGYDGENIISTETATIGETFAYDSDGRLSARESDWTFGTGKDGTFDIRYSWVRDDAGHVRAYEQDGTHHNDAPVIDGVADLQWTFSPSCDAIGAVHAWIYNTPEIIDVGHPMPAFPL